MLGPILVERNVVLAAAIVAACREAEEAAGRGDADAEAGRSEDGGLRGDLLGDLGEPGGDLGKPPRGAIVAVLGMAHCNGVKRIIEAGLTRPVAPPCP